MNDPVLNAPLKPLLHFAKSKKTIFSVRSSQYFLYKGLLPNFASNIKRIYVNYLTFIHLKSSENLWFSDDFRGNRS